VSTKAFSTLSVVRRRSTVFTAIADAAHFQVGDRRALAGMDVFQP